MDKENLIIAKLLTSFSAPAFENSLTNSENFEWIRDAALYQLGCQLLQTVNLLGCTPRENCPIKESSLVKGHTVFSWDVKDFIKRRAETGIILSVLDRAQTSEELMAQKWCADIHELTKYIKIFFQYYLQHIEKSTFDLKAFLNKAFGLTEIFRKLRQDFTKNKKHWNKLVLTKHTYKFIGSVHEAITPIESEQSSRNHLMQLLEDNFRAVLTEDNLEQSIDHINQYSNHLQTEIDRYNKLIQREQFAFSCISDIQSAAIENYKQRLVALDSVFERRRDDLESRNSLLKQSIEKLGEFRQFFEESITHIRSCLERWREEDLEEEKIKAIKKRSTVKKAQSRSPKRKNAKKPPNYVNNFQKNN